MLKRTKLILLFLILVSVSVTVFSVYASHSTWGMNWGTKGVAGDGTVSGLGNCKKHGGCIVEATIISVGDGLAWCGNPGANAFIVPGINPVIMTADDFIGAGDINRNGKAAVHLVANADPATSGICPNDKWLVDYIPGTFNAFVQAVLADNPSVVVTQAHWFGCTTDLSTLDFPGERQDYTNCIETH